MKIRAKFEKAVKNAVRKATPVVKREIKGITTRYADSGIDVACKIIGVVGFGVVMYAFSKAPKKTAEIATETNLPQVMFNYILTGINVDTINL